jgi:hypothetical protein
LVMSLHNNMALVRSIRTIPYVRSFADDRLSRHEATQYQVAAVQRPSQLDGHLVVGCDCLALL